MKALLLLPLVGCATVPAPAVILPAPTFPSYQALLPPDETPPTPAVAPGSVRFEDKVVADKACGGPGVLLDEATYVRFVWLESRTKRLTSERDAIKSLQEAQDKAFGELVTQYAKWMQNAQQKLAEPPNFWERTQFPLGFALGAALVVGTTYAISK